MLLPLRIKADTIADLATQYPPIPLPPAVAAHLIAYAEFLLPICLVVGFATRFASLGLILIAGMVALFVVPQSLSAEPVYWAALLLVLVSLGGGALSVDRVIRLIARR
jgi:putative oxidoreductase